MHIIKDPDRDPTPSTCNAIVTPPTISVTSGTNYWSKDTTTNIYLNQTGNVGIGTTPTTKLHVYDVVIIKQYLQVLLMI